MLIINQTDGKPKGGDILMKRSNPLKGRVSPGTNFSEALSKLPPSAKWFKFTPQEKIEFERAKDAEKRSKKVGFILGGTLKQIL